MLTIEEQTPLSAHTTLQVGGVAAYMATVTTMDELRAALQFAKQTAVPPLVIAGGSNLLISDAGYPGLVIKMALTGRTFNENGEQCVLRVGAGEVLDEVVADTVERGLWGMENLSSIPGSVGATPVQNVGAYGVEVSSLIVSVEAINIHTFEEKTFSNEACTFAYRDSFFKTNEGKDWIITYVTFSLSTRSHPQLQYADLKAIAEEASITVAMIRTAVISIRANKFPDWKAVGTAGSFFKNPVVTEAHFNELKNSYPDVPGHMQKSGNIKVSLGWILDKVCGLKGYCEGPVCLYEKQALVLVNNGGATAEDIKNFSTHIKEKVFEKTKIKIESEVVHVMI